MKPKAEPQGEVDPNAALLELAEAHGVATEYWDWQGRHTVVPRETVLAVLAALEVDAVDPRAVQRSLAELRDRRWRQVLPEVTVLRQGAQARIPVHTPHGEQVELWVLLEDEGGRIRLSQEERWIEPQVLDEALIGESTFVIPSDLPLGWHRLQARYSGGVTEQDLVITPRRIGLPQQITERRSWGFTTSLYAMRSQYSWGAGDLADLSELVVWSAHQHGADFVLVDPLHSAEIISPIEPSPYRPVTRRYPHPIHLRIEEIREVAYMPSTDRALIEWQAEPMRGMNFDAGPIDRDVIWEAKRFALETVFSQPRSRSRQAAFDAFCEREGQGLLDFASWAALSEHYGPLTSSWPEHVRDFHSPTVGQMREELADRVQFHMWLQWCLDEQLAAVQRQAVDAGMAVGLIQEIAVGSSPDGADVWAMPELHARGISIGAPADAANPQGQDWELPPWRPDRLSGQGYRAYRDMLRTIFRNSGAVRLDHVIGLFRLWWVPQGASASSGTYVRYDHEAMVGILVLEAQRAGAFVIAEDMASIEPWAADYLRERGLLSTSVLWWERDHESRPLRPQAWPEQCLAMVTDTDLPTAAGYLAGGHPDARGRSGAPSRGAGDDAVLDEADRSAVLGFLQELGLLGEQSSERERVEALYRFLTWTPAKLIGVALADAVGDRRARHDPGTEDYPNWSLPLADGAGRAVLLEDIMTSARAASLARAINGR